MIENLIDDISVFSYIYLFCFLGAFSKDLVDIFLERTTEILIIKIITSSLAVAILLFGFSDYILNRVDYKPFTVMCYIFGLVSFELIVKYSNTKEIGKLIKDFKEYRKNKISR